MAMASLYIFLLGCVICCSVSEGHAAKENVINKNIMFGMNVVLNGEVEVSTGKGCFWYQGKQRCITKTVNLFEGKESNDLFWFFKQHGDNKFYKVAQRVSGKANCSLSPQLKHRLVSCNTTFKLLNARLSDRGQYKLRFREGKRKSMFFFFNVDVQILSPVLVPKALSKYNFVVECLDRNKNVNCQPRYKQTFVTTSKRIKQSADGSSLLVTQMHAKFRTRDTISCCSYWEGWQVCGPSVLVSVDGSVCTNEAQRNWCKASRGVHFGAVEAHSGPGWEKVGDKYVENSTCLVSKLGPGNVTACENKSIVLHETGGGGDWMRQRQYADGNKWRSLVFNGSCIFERISSCKGDLTFRPLVEDTNNYKTKGNDSSLFNLKVISSPGVMLELLEMTPTHFKLKCNHGGFEKVKITWFVSGIFESYITEGNGDRIKVWPDCWYSKKYWQARMKIQCKVEGETWRGTSPAFYMEAFRNGCHWRTPKPGFGAIFGIHVDA